MSDKFDQILGEIRESRKETQEWRETLVKYIAKNDEKMERFGDKLTAIGSEWWDKDGRLGGKSQLNKLVDSENDKRIMRGVVASTLIGLVGERAYHLFFK